MISNKQKLKMSLQEIRDSIDLNKTIWKNIGDTNCYAFALGLDVVEESIIEHAYIPGVMSGSSIKLCNDNEFDNSFKYDDFINNLYMDLNFLGISYREIYSDEKITDDEWKIAIYTSPHILGGCDDFHFLRLCNDGYWHHTPRYILYYIL